MKFINKIWAFTLAAVATASLAACNDDDVYFDDKYQSTPITVKQVYLEDAESNVPDRAVDFARLGQTIRLEGSGFMGLKKVYVNGYDTYFNRALLSDNSMLLSLNSKTPIVDADESVRNTIRLVKDGAECVYQITVRAASPAVTSVSNTLPQPGERVRVYGANLEETTSVTLPGGIVVTNDITSDPDGEWYEFTMPQGVTAGGCLYSEGANGFAQTPDYFNFTDCMFMNFDGVGQQGYWGGKDDDGNIKPGANMIYAEDLVDDPAGTGRGLCAQIPQARLLEGDGISSGKSRIAECWTAGDGYDREDWSWMYPYIPADTPVTDFALQFDVLTNGPWAGSGQIEIVLVNNYNFTGVGTDDDNASSLTAFFIPYIEGGLLKPFDTEGKWVTVTIPFSKIGKYAAMMEDDEAPKTATLADVVADRMAATYPNFGMGFTNPDFTLGEVPVESIWLNNGNMPGMFFDNWRLVPCKAVTISDFPDEEEAE